MQEKYVMKMKVVPYNHAPRTYKFGSESKAEIRMYFNENVKKIVFKKTFFASLSSKNFNC